MRSQPCFFAVDMTERRVAKSSAPPVERKPPEIFCLAFIMRASRSPWLLEKGTAGSWRKRKASDLRVWNRKRRLCPVRRGLRPRRWPPSLTVPLPGTPVRMLNEFRSPAQFRLIFEEFFWLECGLEIKRQKARTMPEIEFKLDRSRAGADQKLCCPSNPPARRSAC